MHGQWEVSMGSSQLHGMAERNKGITDGFRSITNDVEMLAATKCITQKT